MQLVIDQADFARLSSGARSELLNLFGPQAQAQSPTAAAPRRNFRWRQPHDVALPLLRKLLKGADAATRERLTIFARN
ncbi:MAG TPA: hypothetical protein VKA15_23185, partial [Isosphaeraceae bacterium]|nr:hypothetical protein [Isosphaeraceae bacterium]